MKVRVTPIGSLYKSYSSHIPTGEYVEGTIDSWADISLGNILTLKDAHYSTEPTITIKETIICREITKIVSHNVFEGRYATFKIEEI